MKRRLVSEGAKDISDTIQCVQLWALSVYVLQGHESTCAETPYAFHRKDPKGIESSEEIAQDFTMENSVTDNARPHTAHLTLAKIAGYGWTLRTALTWHPQTFLEDKRVFYVVKHLKVMKFDSKLLKNVSESLNSTLQLVKKLDRYPFRKKRKIDSVEQEEKTMNIKKEATTQVG
ncbi:hypothetical protein LAZ67_17002280 [Cordylochernes scorpioides]|uniref:Transposase n=1 Tax=Cordylochernes scorpioides TaxID=51811 RepID=A0ABY6LE69_9ARAC|nr:hypothetical protein LAZ67_17002280 [Cordylochernes scorpioides]